MSKKETEAPKKPEMKMVKIKNNYGPISVGGYILKHGEHMVPEKKWDEIKKMKFIAKQLEDKKLVLVVKEEKKKK